MSGSVIVQRLLLFFTVIACCMPADAQLPCCQLQLIGNFSVLPGGSPISVAFSPNGSCLATANQNTDNISLFTVNSDCSLNLPPSINMVNNFPRSVAFSPNGSCLAVANFLDDNITVFTLDNCSVSGSATVSLPVGVSGPQSLAFSPLPRNCLAVVSSGDTPNVSMFMVDPDTCSLSPIGIPMPVDTSPRSVAFSPDGTCLAVANQTAGNISVFRVNSDCTLEEVTGSPFSVAPGNTGPTSVDFSPTNNCLAVTNLTSRTISIFTINPDCTLNTPETTYGAAEGIGINPSAVAFSPNGTCLAVANQDSSSVSVFTVNSDCSLTPLPDSPFEVPPVLPTPSRPISLAFSPTSNCLAVSSLGTQNVTMFSFIIALQPIITSAMVTNCNVVTVTGTSSANATITLLVDGISNAMGATEDDGSFSIDTTPLSAGPHSITAVATVSGCTSTPSDAAIVTVDLPIITSVSVGCGNFVVVTGTGTPNSMVSIAADGVTIATGMTNSEGTFVFAGIQLSSGMHCITATDITSGCTSTPVCIDVTPLSCVLGAPNLAFGTHCNRLQ